MNFTYEEQCLLTIDGLNKIYESIKTKGEVEQSNQIILESMYEHVEKLLTKNKNDIQEHEIALLELLIQIAQYAFNNLSLEIIPDYKYDLLYALYNYITEKDIIGSINDATDKDIVTHKYPEMRGTLDKVHFITEADRKKDPRKSIEGWIKSLNRNYGVTDIGKVKLSIKYDGISIIHECNNNALVETSLTRGDVEKNEAVDLSRFFKGFSFESIAEEEWGDDEFAVKTETIMTSDNFNKLIKKITYKNRRSAISSIFNSDEVNEDMMKYVTCVPLRIQNSETGEVKIVSDKLHPELHTIIELNDLSKLEKEMTKIRERADKMGIPNDGIVISIIDEKIQDKVGRANNINKFEVAFKFPAEAKKTNLKEVIFSVGNLGYVTPVAKIKPVVIKGNTISSISLGSVERFKSLDIHLGDEVIIRYDIIPYMDKDSSCISGLGEYVKVPTECPYCGENLKEAPILKCVNKDCEGIQIGKILTYVTKMSIPNISVGTITTLYKNNLLKSIKDLYRLDDKGIKNQIVGLNGFGEKSINKIIKGIKARSIVHDWELLGSLGIQNVGQKIFKRISVIYYIGELMNITSNNNINKLLLIGGIKEKTAQKIIDGINENKELIEYLCSVLEVKDTKGNEKTYTKKVCFTKVRDADFAKYLESKNILVMEKYNKQVDVLIVPDGADASSKKIEKALKDGKDVSEITQAYYIFGYKK